jgi:hypothetical protein
MPKSHPSVSLPDYSKNLIPKFGSLKFDDRDQTRPARPKYISNID